MFARGSRDGGHGWYLGLGAGWASADSLDVRLKPSGVNGHADLDDAIRGSVAVGYKMDNDVRLELEGAFSRHDTGRLSATGYGWAHGGGDVGLGSILANAAYDAPIGDGFALTFGGGAGWGWADSSISGPVHIGGSDGLLPGNCSAASSGRPLTMSISI